MGSKGQTFMPDYMGSLLVFGIILTIFLSSWNSVLNDQTEFKQEEDMRFQGTYTTTFLVSTPGYPNDWNSSNVMIPGFARPDHVLQEEKLEEFHDISYEKQARLLKAENFYLEIVDSEGPKGESLGRGPIAYMVRQGRTMSEVELLHVLNRSDVRWDLYWPSSKNKGLLDSLNARHVYNYTYQSDDMFDDMLVNASSGKYGTVVAENTNLDTGDITQEDELESFVRSGGSFIQIEEKPELVRDTFGLDDVSVGSGNGTVVNSSTLLSSEYETGDFVQFQDEKMAFENVDKVIVRDTQSPYGCLACRWNIESGRVYYIQDELAEGGTDMTTFEEAERAFHSLFSFGRYYDDAETVVPFTRTVQVNLSGRMETAKLRYVV
ncbi:MAG: hypothetical protein ABEI58_01900, partial [Candidatus Nanohaloarchaea archaeon]